MGSRDTARAVRKGAVIFAWDRRQGDDESPARVEPRRFGVSAEATESAHLRHCLTHGESRLTDSRAAARRGQRDRRHHLDRGLRPGKPPDGELDRSEGDGGGEGFGEVLEILGKPPVASEPGEGALDFPAARARTTAPFTSSLRLTSASWSRGTFGTAASTCHAL